MRRGCRRKPYSDTSPNFLGDKMKELVLAGHVYIAQPPLYSTKAGNDTVYLKDDAAKSAFLADKPEP